MKLIAFTSTWRIALVGAVLAGAACSASDPESDGLPDGGARSDAPPTEGPCPAATLCLKPFLVIPNQPVSAARLVVVWFQLRDIWNPNPVEVAFDAPFVPGKSRYELPLAQIRPPVNDRVLLCQWENSVCIRTAPIPPIGFGLPLVLEDTNANGRIDQAEITLNGQGAGMAYLAWSAAAHGPGSPALAYPGGDPTYLADVFTNGIAAGVHAYPVIGGGFDQQLGQADTANGADLALCPKQSTNCTAAAPRLVGSTYPR